MPDPLEQLRVTIRSAADSLRDGAAGSIAPTLERPPDPELGDYSTNAAMLLAPARGLKPREIAERLREELDGLLGGSVDRIEVAGPGFVNVFLTDRWHRESLAALLDAGDAFGRGTARAAGAGPDRVRLRQPDRAADRGPRPSRRLRRLAGPPPYPRRPPGRAGVLPERRRRPGAPLRGVDRRPHAGAGAARRGLPGRVRHRARAGAVRRGRRPGRSRRPRPRAGSRRCAAGSRRRWIVSASTSTAGSRSVRCTRAARSSGRSRRSASAATCTRARARSGCARRAFGDDKDRVLIRSDGEPTYFGADIAYHRDKLERGADRLVDPLGADHHGYVARMRAAIEALGADPDRFEAPLIQFVHLVEGTARAQMSKRQRRVRDPRRADRRHRRRRGAIPDAAEEPRDRRSTWTSSWRAASRRTTPSTTSSTRTPGSRASCARR